MCSNVQHSNLPSSVTEHTIITMREIKHSYMAMSVSKYNTNISNLLHTPCQIESKHFELEALRERRPPWPRQIITPILPTVKMLNFGGERLPPPPPPPKKKKKNYYLHHYYDIFFAHLLILNYPDHHQNLINSSLYYPGLFHKISSQSVRNCWSKVHRQTDRRTKAAKNVTSFAKEIINIHSFQKCDQRSMTYVRPSCLILKRIY